ncbi:MAG TPA: M20/M25/M40 family metallo-hydrolase, partial [Firmicutes bacterium]|nr:M20/M25/M40 family metallo-hydrolase [Candidatus Fermentithermobacillaceae bacterium]
MRPLRLAETLSDYLRIQTENPPGREMPALEFLDGILKQRGLEPVIHETAPHRGVLECSIGPSEGGSIVLLHHVDVVPATNEGWDVPPYSGEIRDGYIWGRGALDMKGMGIMELGAFLAMAG